MKQINPFYFLTAAVILLLVLPQMVQHGMFMDGTQYACVARNLAFGKGTFWNPHLSDSWSIHLNTSFQEHPPLMYFLEAGVFKIVGDTIYAERIYSFILLLVSCFFIYRIWEQVVPNAKATGWLPLLLWIVTPSVFWGLRSNVLENTLSVFVLMSVYFSLRSITSESNRALNLLLSGLSIFLATLSKGIPGFFPLTFFILYAIIIRGMSSRKMLIYTLVILIVPVLIYAGLILFSENAAKSLNFYFSERLLHRINEDPLVNNRFTILYWLVCELLIPFGASVLTIVLLQFKKVAGVIDLKRKRFIWFFVAIGCAGALPLMLTYVQRAPYYIPALPFFAIAAALIAEDALNNFIEKISFSTVYTLMRKTIVVLPLAVIFYCSTLVGKISRDEDELRDVFLIGNTIPKNSYVEVPHELYDKWDFQFYLLRYYNIVLWPHNEEGTNFYICKKNGVCDTVTGYKKIDIGLKNYVLYSRFLNDAYNLNTENK